MSQDLGINKYRLDLPVPGPYSLGDSSGEDGGLFRVPSMACAVPSMETVQQLSCLAGDWSKVASMFHHLPARKGYPWRYPWRMLHPRAFR